MTTIYEGAVEVLGRAARATSSVSPEALLEIREDENFRCGPGAFLAGLDEEADRSDDISRAFHAVATESAAIGFAAACEVLQVMVDDFPDGLAKTVMEVAYGIIALELLERLKLDETNMSYDPIEAAIEAADRMAREYDEALAALEAERDEGPGHDPAWRDH